MASSNILKKQRDSRVSTINRLLDSEESNWFRYYDHIETMLREFRNYTNEINEEDKRLYFHFIEKVFNQNKENKLSDTSKDILFDIAENELKNTYNLNNVNDVEKIYRLFYIFIRLDYKTNKYKVEIIFNLLDYYAIQIASHRIAFNSENEKKIRFEFKKIFWVLQLNFENYAKSLVDFYGIDDFKWHFYFLKKINQNIYQWDSNSIFSFRLSLNIVDRLRSHYLNRNQEIELYLNNMAKDHISETLRLVENTYFSLTKEDIKETAYIAYVKNLPNQARLFFKNLYKDVKKSQVFPYSLSYKVSPSTNVLQFLIFSHKKMRSKDKSIIENTIYNTYQRVEIFKSRLNIIYKENVSSIIFRLHLFKDHESYSKYGPLWGVNTAGGGYANVRIPSDDDLKFYNIKSQSNELWYENFVYQQEFDTRNPKNKEGGSFRNLGHKIQHTLFYALIGARQINNLPSWLVEGIANYLGNEDCFKEEADYIKNAQTEYRLLSIEQIINLSYADGGDLYYFGSTLVHFMLENHPNILKNILTSAQSGKKESEINQIIEKWADNSEIENKFKIWTTQLINGCSTINQGEPEPSSVDVQMEYHKDLKDNPSLLNLIQKQHSITVTFNDIIFTLKQDQLIATNYFRERDTKRLKEISSSDYVWFKSALASYTIQVALQPFKLPAEYCKEIIKIFLHTDDKWVENRLVKSIQPQNYSYFNPAIKEFVLNTYFNKSNQAFSDDLAKTVYSVKRSILSL